MKINELEFQDANGNEINPIKNKNLTKRNILDLRKLII